MNFLDSSRPTKLGIMCAFGVLGALGGCGGGTSATATAGNTTSSSGGSRSGADAGVSSSGAGTSSSSSSGGTGSSTSSSGAGADASNVAADVAADGAMAAEAGSEGGNGADDGPAGTIDAQTCVKGQVAPSKVIVIGDSYLDHPTWSNAIPDLYADLRATGALGATATYREYQLGGATMNYGTFNLNIPYQYETSAKTDPAVMNPKDIDTIIMDGGGNDVLINNQGCLTNAQPPPGNTTCATAIQGTVDRASKLLQQAATDGVKHVVYLFYPHLDPAGGGILPAPSPQVNATLDYAYPLAEKVCCGQSFTSTATSYTCSGNTSGTECVFIDIRPAFEGHLADYIKSDHVHPTDAGAKVIADLIASAMRDYCIAQ